MGDGRRGRRAARPRPARNRRLEVGAGFVDSIRADGTAVAGSRVWTLGGGTLRGVDAATGRPTVAPVRVGRFPAALVAGAGRLYVIEQYGGGRISQISASTGRSAGRAFLPGPRLWSGVVAHGSLWVTRHGFQTPAQRRRGGFAGRGSLLRLNPASGRPQAAVRVGHEPFEVVAAAGWLWVLDPHDGTLTRVDPRGDRVRAVHRVPGRPTAVAFAAGYLWVNGPPGVLRVDPRSGRVVGRTRVPGGVSDLEAGAGGLWAGVCGGRVVRLSVPDGRITARFTIPSARRGVCG